jgi:hypothetical protein
MSCLDTDCNCKLRMSDSIANWQTVNSDFFQTHTSAHGLHVTEILTLSS